MNDKEIITIINDCIDSLESDVKAEKQWHISIPVHSFEEYKKVETFVRAYLESRPEVYSLSVLSHAIQDVTEFVAVIDTPEHERKRLGFK